MQLETPLTMVLLMGGGLAFPYLVYRSPPERRWRLLAAATLAVAGMRGLVWMGQSHSRFVPLPAGWWFGLAGGPSLQAAFLFASVGLGYGLCLILCSAPKRTLTQQYALFALLTTVLFIVVAPISAYGFSPHFGCPVIPFPYFNFFNPPLAWAVGRFPEALRPALAARTLALLGPSIRFACEHLVAFVCFGLLVAPFLLLTLSGWFFPNLFPGRALVGEIRVPGSGWLALAAGMLWLVAGLLPAPPAPLWVASEIAGGLYGALGLALLARLRRETRIGGWLLGSILIATAAFLPAAALLTVIGWIDHLLGLGRTLPALPPAPAPLRSGIRAGPWRFWGFCFLYMTLLALLADRKLPAAEVAGDPLGQVERLPGPKGDFVRIDPYGAGTRFWIDATPRPSQSPSSRTPDAASSVCARRGGRLCSAGEWELACRLADQGAPIEFDEDRFEWIDDASAKPFVVARWKRFPFDCNHRQLLHPNQLAWAKTPEFSLRCCWDRAPPPSRLFK